MENEGFYVFGAVVLLITIVLFMGVGITGKAVIKTGSSSCLDSDGGQKPFVKGSVVGLNKINSKTTSQIDKCSEDGVYLKEGYCKQGILSVKTYKCTSGCLNGACVE